MEKEVIINRINELVGDKVIEFHIENCFHEYLFDTKMNMKQIAVWTRETIIRGLDKEFPEPVTHKQSGSSVDHPAHYNPGTYETINVIEAYNLNFCLGNAIKYILRAGKKNIKSEDLQKAIWYLQRELTHDL